MTVHKYMTAILFLHLAMLMVFQADFSNAAEKTQNGKEEKSDSAEKVEKDTGPVFERKGMLFENKPEGVHQPWQLLRAIQRQQDRIVAGEKNATKAYRILLVQSANWMFELNDRAWQYERNLDALATYLLIGGRVELGYKALQRTRLKKPHTLLLKAAIAYSERDIVTAHDLITKIDHASLPPSVSGQVALAKAMIFSSSDLSTAASFLEEARLLAPGTLIEEAAIRREIRIAAELKSVDTLKYLYKTYLRRFANSHYFTDFLRNASYAFVNVSQGDGSDIIPDLDYFLAQLDTDQKIKVLEYVARRSATTGRFELAGWATAFALDNLDKGSKVHTRLTLYAAASKIVMPKKTEETLQSANSINEDHLKEYDQNLLKAVKILGDKIMSEKSMKEFSAINGPATGSEQISQENSALQTDTETESGAELDGELMSRQKRFEAMTEDMNKIMSGAVQ
ncbi:MAG: hypothetical protein AAGA76_11260 [Pseudomonadota bacterium]